MNIDLFKYIMKMIVVPMLLLSLVLIIHGSDDNISITNVIGFILLIISGSYIIVDAKNKDEQILKHSRCSKCSATSTVCEDSTSLFINLINIIMGKTFKDFDSEGRFKGVYLSKYLTDEEKTKVKRFAKLDK